MLLCDGCQAVGVVRYFSNNRNLVQLVEPISCPGPCSNHRSPHVALESADDRSWWAWPAR